MRISLICILCIVALGCSIPRDLGKIGCEELTLNAQSVRELAVCILENWEVHSGLIRGALGEKIKELPVEVVEAMDELDEYSMRDPSDFTDMELGMTVGLKLRLLWSIVAKALETYAPKVLDLVPLLI